VWRHPGAATIVSGVFVFRHRPAVRSVLDFARRGSLSYGLAVHDYFDILGVPSNAPAREIRQACARHVRRSHPDFFHAGCPRSAGSAAGSVADARTPAFPDAAVDFVEMTPLIDRMQIAFFSTSP
jgi:hypothetical protein